MDGRIYPFRGHIWAEGDRICRLEDLSCWIYHLHAISGQDLPFRSHIRVKDVRTNPRDANRGLQVIGNDKVYLRKFTPMTRLLVMAGLSHRPPGLPGITPERTPPPLSPMGVIGLTQVAGSGRTYNREATLGPHATRGKKIPKIPKIQSHPSGHRGWPDLLQSVH